MGGPDQPNPIGQLEICCLQSLPELYIVQTGQYKLRVDSDNSSLLVLAAALSQSLQGLCLGDFAEWDRK